MRHTGIAIVAIGLVVGFLIGTCLIQFNKYTKASTAYSLELLGQIDNLEKKVDSLETELFFQRSRVGQYEVALEILKEHNVKGASKLQQIINTETE